MPPAKRVQRPLKKLLVANRGEIAVRIIRTAREMGIKTVSVYAKEDSQALHRIMSDESYLIGSNLSPVGAYLSIEDLVKVAKEHKVDAIHPGYGFLSENHLFSKTVEDNGIMFVGPHHSVVNKMGDKIEARVAAMDAGVSVIPGSSAPVKNFEEMKAICDKIGYPVMLKAAYGGGGRGMRVVNSSDELKESFERASSEAVSAFGNGSMFVEKMIQDGKHIEVQIFGDNDGNIVHMHERDCSVQRRHQKVIEIAPSHFLPENVKQKLYDDAVKITKFCGYQNAGTVEFLVDESNRHYFIEVNARLQVEHTVTEELTGYDLVRIQLRVREGKTLESMGITQKTIDAAVKGRNISALQCRVTTEDSQKNFRPSTGRIDLFQPANGLGVRLDGAIAASGAVVTPHYDSLLVKMIVTGQDFKDTVNRSIRALEETRIRGVTTNIPFILNVLKNKKFLTGDVNVRFIDQNPQLLVYDTLSMSSQNLCKYLAEVIVNGPMTQLVNSTQPSRIAAVLPPMPEGVNLKKARSGAGSWAGPPQDLDDKNPVPTPKGYKQILDDVGPEQFAKVIRAEKQLLLTDTSMRDAHQSLFATRMRSTDMLKIAPAYTHTLPRLFSLENWGGATFDVAYRFLRESPWKRLEQLREEIPNIPFQMLIRGSNAVGYTSYPDNVVYKFCEEAYNAGIDIFRVFDCLNNVDNMKMGIQAAGSSGGVVEAAISYTGDVSDPTRKPYTLEYYLDLARKLVAEKPHFLAVKDMAGLLTPDAAHLLVSALRKEFEHIPIHIHTHDTAGTGVATYIAAARAGADIVDVAMDSLAGLTSQPSMGAVVASLKRSPEDTMLDLETISGIADYWETVRGYYAPFEATATLKSGSADVYKHEIPGGQYTNLHMQAWSMGMADKWPQIKKTYAEANKLLGDLIKVTPSSKVVGDMAQFMVQNKLDSSNILEKADELSFPQSVIEFFQGYIGTPPFGFPEKLSQKVLKGAPVLKTRAGSSLPAVDLDAIQQQLEERFGRKFRAQEVLSAVLYPKIFEEYLEFEQLYGDVSILPTANYFTGAEPNEEISVDMAQRQVDIKFLAKSPIHHDGTRDVYFEVMGLPRSVTVRDQTANTNTKQNMKAQRDDIKQIPTPMPGNILNYKVKEGDTVNKGDPLVVISAMKMETVVVSPITSKVKSIPLHDGDVVEAGDLVIKLE